MAHSKFKLNHKIDLRRRKTDYIYDSIRNSTVKGQPKQKIINFFKLNRQIPNNLLIISRTGILDQGPIGTCGPNAFSVIISIASNSRINDSSRLYTYFNTECMDRSNPFTDNGVTTYGLILCLANYKACRESQFTYDIAQNAFKLPPYKCYKNTYNIRNVTYRYIEKNNDMLQNIQNCLLNTSNFPTTQSTGILFAFRLFTNFPRTYAPFDGIIPMPGQGDTIIGGHAVVIVGYKLINNITYVTFQNSWGSGWGDNGYGYFPIQFLMNPTYCERPNVISFTY